MGGLPLSFFGHLSMPQTPDPTPGPQNPQRGKKREDHDSAELLERVGAEMRRLAAGYLSRQDSGHTLQPTALVNEAYLKLIDSTVIRTDDRERFLATAAQAMRQVLVDSARKRHALRRGGSGWQRVSLHPDVLADDVLPHDEFDVLDLDDALTRLAQAHAMPARVVELRYFGGLTVEETAGVLSVSERMVGKYWFLARAWLGRELGSTDTT